MLKKSLDLSEESLVTSLILLVLLTLAFYSNIFFPLAAQIMNMSVIAFELLLPFWLLQKRHLDPKDFALHAHGLENLSLTKNNLLDIRKDLYKLFLTCIFILLPYVIFYLLFMLIKANFLHLNFYANFTWPPNIFYQLLIQIFVVAMPEECFYRGFLQNSLLKKYSPTKAIILTNILFALGHLVGGLNPVRLLTFFPGLVFSFLAYKTKSIFTAVLFHALCNILEKILYAGIMLN